MSRKVENWLEQIDDRGAGALAPPWCRDNLLKADALLAPCEPWPLHFAELPLLGSPGLDMTWSVSLCSILESTTIPPELEGVKRLAEDMAPNSFFGFEYDTSEPQLPPAGFYYKGMLADGGHAVGRMLECVGRSEVEYAALLMAAKLARLGYESRMCGVMAGREGAPVRITARPIGDFSAAKLIADLTMLGLERPPLEALAQLNLVCRPNVYITSAPLVYLDLMPDGSLGTMLGIELNGIRAGNIDDYPQMRLAREWGLADDRCEILRDASFDDGDGFFFLPNTLKFRWSDGEPLPAKLYLKAGWM